MIEVLVQSSLGIIFYFLHNKHFKLKAYFLLRFRLLRNPFKFNFSKGICWIKSEKRRRYSMK